MIWATVNPKINKGKPIKAVAAMGAEFKALALACRYLEQECLWAQKINNLDYYLHCLVDYQQAVHECRQVELKLRESIR